MRRHSDRTRSAGPLKSSGSGRGSDGFAHHSCKATLPGTRRRSSSDRRAFTGGPPLPSCTGAHSRSTGGGWRRTPRKAPGPARSAPSSRIGSRGPQGCHRSSARSWACFRRPCRRPGPSPPPRRRSARSPRCLEARTPRHSRSCACDQEPRPPVSCSEAMGWDVLRTLEGR